MAKFQQELKKALEDRKNAMVEYWCDPLLSGNVLRIESTDDKLESLISQAVDMKALELACKYIEVDEEITEQMIAKGYFKHITPEYWIDAAEASNNE